MFGHMKYIQKSPANTKSWYVGHNTINHPNGAMPSNINSKLISIVKYFQCATIPSLTMRVYLHSFKRCCLPKNAK